MYETIVYTGVSQNPIHLSRPWYSSTPSSSIDFHFLYYFLSSQWLQKSCVDSELPLQRAIYGKQKQELVSFHIEYSIPYPISISVLNVICFLTYTRSVGATIIELLSGSPPFAQQLDPNNYNSNDNNNDNPDNNNNNNNSNSKNGNSPQSNDKRSQFILTQLLLYYKDPQIILNQIPQQASEVMKIAIFIYPQHIIVSSFLILIMAIVITHLLHFRLFLLSFPCL